MVLIKCNSLSKFQHKNYSSITISLHNFIVALIVHRSVRVSLFYDCFVVELEYNLLSFLVITLTVYTVKKFVKYFANKWCHKIVKRCSITWCCLKLYHFLAMKDKNRKFRNLHNVLLSEISKLSSSECIKVFNKEHLYKLMSQETFFHTQEM